MANQKSFQDSQVSTKLDLAFLKPLKKRFYAVGKSMRYSLLLIEKSLV